MRNAVRLLERRLACLVAQSALEPIVEDYVDRWRAAVDQDGPPPDVFDLVHAATAERVPMLNAGGLVSYIEQCADNDRVPDSRRIIQTIVHGHAQRYYFTNHAKTCRCPARMPLIIDYSPYDDDHDHDN